MIAPLQATLLGIVEGLTEYLPISSTGHLILAAQWLGLSGEAVKTFEIVIQAGAIAAVLGLYRARVATLWQGLLGRDAQGRSLLLNLMVSFLPAALLGVVAHHQIKALLFSTWPVVGALAAGGLLMVALDGWLRSPSRATSRTLETLSVSEALLIGLAQCLALWPGTSRSMVTIVAGMLVGLPAPVAAEYSFLLALPTLGAATVFDAVRGGGALLQHVGALSVICGFLAAALVAAVTVKGLVRYLNRRGLALFGWYRLGLAGLVWWVASR